MVAKETFFRMALDFPGAEQKPHFERIGFKVSGKRMFATYLEADHTANIFLSRSEQHAFCQLNPKSIFPVPNKWGDNGITTFVLDALSAEIVQEALLSAYQAVLSPKKTTT